MIFIFSRRHRKALANGQLIINLAQQLRKSLWLVVTSYDKSWGETNETGWNYYNSYSDVTKIELRKHWGRQVIGTNEKGHNVDVSLEDLFLTGSATDVLDAIEVFLSVIDETVQTIYQTEINMAFALHSSSWRLIEKRIYKIDSSFLEDEVLEKSFELLDAPGFEGALDEFRQARECLAAGENRQAVIMTNNALESTMKSILHVQAIKPGMLVRKMVDSGIIPEYYQDFLKNFEQILLVVSTERNQPGREHGQGATLTEVPRSLAELVFHLSGVLIVFLIKQHFDKRQQASDNEVPF